MIRGKSREPAQFVQRQGVRLLVFQNTDFSEETLYSFRNYGALFVPRGRNVAKAVSIAVEKIRTGTVVRYEGPYQEEFKKSLLKLADWKH